MDCFAIINPMSGKGKGKKVWPKIQTLLSSRFNVSHAFTTHAKHETELAQNAVKKGFKTIILIGGDGTFKNSINGVYSLNIEDAKSLTFGFIPLGTGNDWVKTHNISKNIEKAVDTIIKGKTDVQDVGCIKFLNSQKPSEYFINLTGIGYDGYVVNLIGNRKKCGPLTYIFGGLKGILSLSHFNAKITSGSYSYSGKLFLIQFGICKFCGNGMRFTDTPDPKDGLLDITIAKNFGRWDAIKSLPYLFNGTLVKHKKVHVFKTNRITVTTEEENKPFVQADGELLGKESIEVSILKHALKFYC